MQMLASHWLSALSVTVIIPIQLTEKENHWPPCGFLVDWKKERRAASGHCVQGTVHRSRRSPGLVHGAQVSMHRPSSQTTAVHYSGALRGHGDWIQKEKPPRGTAAAVLYSIAVPAGVHLWSLGARPGRSHRGSGARQSSPTYDGATGLRRCTPAGLRSRCFFRDRAVVVALLSVFNHRTPESASSAGTRPPGDGRPCTAAGSSGRSGHRGAPRRLFFLYSIAVPKPGKYWNSGNVRSNHSFPISCFLVKRRNVASCYSPNSTGTNSILSSRGPSQAKVGGSMKTNSPTDVSWLGFSDLIVCASIFFPFANAGNRGRRTFSLCLTCPKAAR